MREAMEKPATGQRASLTEKEAGRSLMWALARYIEEHCDEPITLEVLSREAQLSPSHLQRRFKAEIGVSPKAYLDACRMVRLKKGLRREEGVLPALYDAGYGAPSRLYEKAGKTLGMTPRQYGRRGKGLEISFATAQTVLGEMLMSATDRGVCSVAFGTGKEDLLRDLYAEFPAAHITPSPGQQGQPLAIWMEALNTYLKGEGIPTDLPLDIMGTAFQKKVWNYLQTIPAGETRTYKQVAEAVCTEKAVRAVASACARNRLAILIPCHRVIRGDGALAGYRWGIERKKRLLEMEGIAPPILKEQLRVLTAVVVVD